MSHAAAISALKKYTKVAADQLPPDNLIEALKDESDRGAIILAVTVVDDALTATLKQHMSHLEKKEMEALYDVENGLLSTFSNRIKIAQAFEIIDRGNRLMLDLLRNMRNAAAHARQETSFKSDVIRGAMLSMFPPEAVADNPGTWPDHQMRGIFCLLCGALADSLSGGDPWDADTGHLRTMKAVESARVRARLEAVGAPFRDK